MKVIHMVRKPLSEGTVAANVLKHGTGALNIDQSRIAPLGEQYGGKDEQGYQRPSGRWPSNLILSHLAECSHEGTRTITTNDIPRAKNVRGTDGQGGQSVYSKYAPLPEKMYGYASEDGTETIDNWRCHPDCPVLDVDVQGGVSKSSGGRAYQNTNDMYSGGWAHKGMGVSQDPGFGDIGGPSRFFKQVQIINEGNNMSDNVPQELLDYLYTMITPTHVGGESLVALDLETVEWSEYKDQQFSGIIARGPIPEGAMDEIWRVLKPGAHVMMIAPDDEPTGHTGACALEDRGFEIRDAILWVREAGKIHYVPKASSRERNAGCGHLAEKRGKDPVYDIHPDISEDVMGEIHEALLEAGVPEEALESIGEVGLQKGQIPTALRKKYFRRREDNNRNYGNHHPCLHPEALVLTEKGYQPIQRVKIGDKVLSADGLFHVVDYVSRHPYKNPNLFRINVEGTKHTTLASDNHPFLIWRPVRDRDGGIEDAMVQWVPASEIRIGDYTMTPGPNPTGFALVEHEGVQYGIRCIKAVEQVPYKGDVVNLSVKGSPTFQTVVGMSHNTVKPKDVLVRLLHDVPEDATILDPFMGSGSLGLACLETGHNYIGIEREAEYIEIADARIRHWDQNNAGWNAAVIESEAPKPKSDEEDDESSMSLDDLFGF